MLGSSLKLPWLPPVEFKATLSTLDPLKVNFLMTRLTTATTLDDKPPSNGDWAFKLPFSTVRSHRPSWSPVMRADGSKDQRPEQVDSSKVKSPWLSESWAVNGVFEVAACYTLGKLLTKLASIISYGKKNLMSTFSISG